MVVIKLRLGNLKMALFHELQGFKKEKKNHYENMEFPER